MTSTLRILLAASLAICVAACGDDEPPKPQKSIPSSDPAKPAAPGAPAAAPAAGAAPAAAAAPAAPTAQAPAVIRGGAGVMIYSKVSDDYRKKLDKADFAPDPTGDMNRDPFRSYLFGQIIATPGPTPEAGIDVCKKRTIAPNAGLRELTLVGVVLRGTRGYAMFIDTGGRGHTVNRGDCLAKEQARVKAIGQDRVTLEIRGEAAQGGAAPDAREETIRLHMDELDVTEESLQQSRETGEQ